jgi:hypothetical protein
LEYLEANKDLFHSDLKELEYFLPEKIRLNCKLYPIVGYDIGIVSQGNAFLNLGYPLFHEHKRELYYFSIHELHHVGYTHYNPIYSLDELKTNKELLEIIKYSTHLEGLAVYSTLELRKKENSFTHRDYIVLNNPSKRSKIVSQFMNTLEQLRQEEQKTLNQEHLTILDQMSDRDRLWYVAGAHMAKTIHERLRRKKLKKTIVDGPDAFFKAYNKALIKTLL